MEHSDSATDQDHMQAEKYKLTSSNRRHFYIFKLLVINVLLLWSGYFDAVFDMTTSNGLLEVTMKREDKCIFCVDAAILVQTLRTTASLQADCNSTFH
jgi:uncharacterized membrane protein YobD (UPF0266 family)